ncbi:MAG TPA: acyl-CoA dehydrogenase family protein [Acidimicrobiia bacterium]|nr:acyl-CoA dehydrogenase family protein [Acidimicrobiia bacterium]
MELELQDDQELFVETTRRFLEAESPLTRVRDLYEDPVGFDRDYWRRGAELGWATMLVPEELGGGSVSGAGLLDLELVAEEMGRTVAPGPLLPVNVVADTLARSGRPDQQEAELAGLVSGERIATWAFAEPSSRWDAGGVALGASERDGAWVLSGTKSYVQDAAVADEWLVTARTGDSLTQFLVAAGTPGVTVAPLQSLDMTRRFGDVVFDGATVDGSAVVGRVGDAAADVERQLQVALTVQNAETVGAVNRVYEFTLEYAQDRMAFGRPIGSYQALKHRFADMKMWLEACNATATASARAVQAGADDAPKLVSTAKAYIGDRAPAIVQDCVQLHGGIGVTWEHDLHLYLRRVAQNAALYGSARDHRLRVATLLGV